MLFIALMGAGLALAGQVWHASLQREREKELLFAGDQIRTAIASYYQGTPGGIRKFPATLEELLEDRRYPTVKRHLRRLYRDPLTGAAQWGLIEAPSGGIMGVYSLSSSTPRKLTGFRSRDAEFENAASFADWKFIVAATEGGEMPPATPTPGTPPVPGVPPTVAEPPPSPPALPPQSDPNRKKVCESIQRIDRNICAGVRQQYGAGPGRQCDQSAQLRHAACMDAQPLPPLVTRPEGAEG
jgi:type II secretory pathway pseudopilin PulG